jgi:hypothetical protein
MADINKDESERIAVQTLDKSETDSGRDVENVGELAGPPKSVLDTKKAVLAWCILCYSVSTSCSLRPHDPDPVPSESGRSVNINNV